MIHRHEIATGAKFGRLTVLGEGIKDKHGHRRLKCSCACGGSNHVHPRRLLDGNTSSCGCFDKERRVKHGLHDSRTYTIWAGMWQRCTNPKSTSYKYYGGRGITVDPRWEDFKNFLEDIGLAPDGLTIERIDNSKGYCKANCKWATMADQALNKRQYGTALA